MIIDPFLYQLHLLAGRHHGRTQMSDSRARCRFIPKAPTGIEVGDLLKLVNVFTVKNSSAPDDTGPSLQLPAGGLFSAASSCATLDAQRARFEREKKKSNVIFHLSKTQFLLKLYVKCGFRRIFF